MSSENPENFLETQCIDFKLMQSYNIIQTHYLQLFISRDIGIFPIKIPHKITAMVKKTANKNKKIRCEFCNREMRSDNLKRHLKACRENLDSAFNHARRAKALQQRRT